MASIIPGYTYDIFISYRQKDNKYDGWVTKFVDNLRKELEATLKEDVSVYFDENPHDRLQETHNVSKSLEDKLKCLIFIPILSQTYCDPGSYAWQNELLAFIKLEEGDYFGKDITLRSGNVAGRILPVRIHDLDPEDVQMFEEATGTMLRALDFVFRTASGVNRPLLPGDEKNDNLDRTLYRDQINKVAGAIKDIILGMKGEPSRVIPENDQTPESVIKTRDHEERIDPKHKVKSLRNRYLITTATVAIVIIAGIIAYPKIFKRDTLEKLRSSGEKISVVVMPFQNRTNDTLLNYWQNGIQDMMINYLSNSDELSLIQTESVNNLLDASNLVNYASITPAVAGNISKKLHAEVLINGSINQAGRKVRFTVQLNDTKTGEVIKPFQIEGPASEEYFFELIDSLSLQIRNFLVVSQLKEKERPDFYSNISTDSPEAYREYISGMKAFGKKDWRTASEYFLNAVKIDTNFTSAKLMLSWSYAGSGLIGESKKVFSTVSEKRDQVPKNMRWLLDEIYVYFTGTGEDLRNLANQLRDNDNQDPRLIHEIGAIYRDLGQHYDAIAEYEKLLDLYKNWNVKPYWAYTYTDLGDSYVKTGQYKKARKVYNQAKKDFPDDNLLNRRQAVLLLMLGDTGRANDYIKKYINILEQNGASEASLLNRQALVYSDAGISGRSGEDFHKALSLEPENPTFLNNLANFIYENNLDTEQGLELIDRALQSDSVNSIYISTKGKLLFKQGKYEEALDLFEKSWALRDYYNRGIELDVQMAKEALASRKNN